MSIEKILNQVSTMGPDTLYLSHCHLRTCNGFVCVRDALRISRHAMCEKEVKQVLIFLDGSKVSGKVKAHGKLVHAFAYSPVPFDFWMSCLERDVSAKFHRGVH